MVSASEIHIERSYEAAAINAILNHALVRPWVADVEGPIDITSKIANRANVLLVGEYGGFFCFCLQPGVYEVHSQVLPAGRGRWMRAFADAGAAWMFERTDAYEIITRVPDGHIAAKALALGAGMRHEFCRPMECQFRGRLRDVHIYSFRVQDWMAMAPGLEEIGAWFHERLNEEARRLGIQAPAHADDPQHNRVVGACWEMARHGQLAKSVLLYNRWSAVTRHATIGLVSVDPPTIRMDIGLLRIKNGKDFEVIPNDPAMAAA